jgi:hypothetical protein
MSAAIREGLHFVLAVVALAGAPACARCETVAGRSLQDPHARALVLAVAVHREPRESGLLADGVRIGRKLAGSAVRG